MTATDTPAETPAPAAPDAPVARKRRPAHVALGWCAQVLAVATLTLALCNAEAARGWANGLTPDTTSQAIRDACETWAATTDALGLSAPRKLIRGVWENRHAWRWPGTTSPPGP